jgi:hypothetical protein
MSDLVKWNPSTQVTRRIDRALEIIKRSEAIQTPTRLLPVPTPQSALTNPACGARAAAVSCLRLCAIKEAPYLAHYTLGGDGRYHHSKCGDLTRALELTMNGAPARRTAIKSEDLGVETCVHCGTSGRGAIRCVCGSFICWGTVIDNRTVSCPSCGYSGPMNNTSFSSPAVVMR